MLYMREQQHNSFQIFVGNKKTFSYNNQNLEVTCDTVLHVRKFAKIAGLITYFPQICTKYH